MSRGSCVLCVAACPACATCAALLALRALRTLRTLRTLRGLRDSCGVLLRLREEEERGLVGNGTGDLPLTIL